MNKTAMERPVPQTSLEVFSLLDRVLVSGGKSSASPPSYEPYAEDPSRFFEDALGIKPWEKQVEIARAVCDNRYVVVPSCFGSGKTFIAAAIVLWYLSSRRGARVVTTATSGRQVKHLLWKEIRKQHAGAKMALPGKPMTQQIVIEDMWDAIGFATRGEEAVGASRFQGVHSQTGHVLVVFDEAQGIQDEIWQAAKGLMISPGCRFLAIGNPLGVGTEFQKAAESSDWKCITISAFETPNVKAGAEVIRGLVSKEWIEERKREHGEDSPYWDALVNGRFPSAYAADAVIQQDWIKMAVSRWEEDQAYWKKRCLALEPVYVGLDVARFGYDRSVWVTMGEDGRASKPEEVRGYDTMSVVGKTVEMTHKLMEIASRVTIAVDETGLGAGVVDRLHELVRNGELKATIIGTNFGAAARSPERYANIREELWGDLREAFANSLLSIPTGYYDEDLREIRSNRYDSKGRRRLESKDEAKARIGHSPDRGDALALAYRALKSATSASVPLEKRAIKAWW